MAVQKSAKDSHANGILAGLVVIALVLIICAVLWQYVGAFFIAVAGYVFFSPLYKFLRKAGLGKTLSGWLTLMVAAIVVVVPGIFIVNALLNETASLLSPAAVSDLYGSVSAGVASLRGYLPADIDMGRINGLIYGALLQAANLIREWTVAWLESAGKLALDTLIIIFVFYYLLVAEGSLGNVRAIIPFSKKNTDELIREFKKVLYSSILVTGLMAIVQVVPLTLVFMYFGVPGAVFLGFIAAILTCIPFTGIPFVWVPVAALELLSGNYAAGSGIVVTGVAIAVIENFRPMLQNRIGEIHPLVSLIGVIIGIVYFGVLGLLIGPILLSFALLTARMFKEEYL